MSRQLVSVIAVLAMTGGAVLAQAPQSSALDSSVTTTGEASLSVAPDVAIVMISAEGRGKKTADAQKISADAMTSLQAALKTLALAPNAIRTTGYTLTPEYDYFNGTQSFRDFLARNTIEVHVDDIKLLPSVIDTAGTTGATTVSGLRFDVKERARIERDLLQQAVKDAMNRAEVIAAGANRQLGSAMRINEQRINNGPMYRAFDSFQAGLGGGRGAPPPPTPVTPGEVEVRAQVSLTIAIR
jgi:hypothetical protein